MTEIPPNNPERTELVSQATLGQLKTLLDTMFGSGGENGLPPPPCLRVTSGGALYSLMPARDKLDPIYAVIADANTSERLVSVRYELDQEQSGLEIKRYVFDQYDWVNLPQMDIEALLNYEASRTKQILTSLRQQDDLGTVWVTEQEGQDLFQTLRFAEPLESL